VELFADGFRFRGFKVSNRNDLHRKPAGRGAPRPAVSARHPLWWIR